MTHLDAARIFGNSSFCPAKKVRIHKEKWYLLRMQNVERDQGDGVYLAAGEYVELLPGNDARQRRDAKLNHCNGISVYEGPVYELKTYPYNHENGDTKHYVSAEARDRAIIAFQERRLKWIADMEKQRDNYLANGDAERIITKAKKTSIGIARIDDPAYIQETIEMYQSWAADVQRTIDNHRDVEWRYETQQLR